MVIFEAVRRSVRWWLSSSMGDRDELLTDMLVLSYPTKKSQSS